MARFAPERDNDSLIGFFSLELVLLGMFAMRSLGLSRSHHCATASSPLLSPSPPRSASLPYSRASTGSTSSSSPPLSAEARLLQILKRLWELLVDTRISGQASKLKLSPRAFTQLGNLPLLAVFDRPLTGWGSFLKSRMDRCLAGVLIVLLSPILAVTPLAVRLDSKGPIPFKQRRYGFNNELIEVYKFRSMHADLSDANAARLVSKDDRV
jgi:hypothetical protein